MAFNGRVGILGRANKFVVLVGVLALAAGLAGCGGTTGSSGSSSGTATPSTVTTDKIVVGTTDKVTMLDPAGSYDRGTIAVQIQVFSFLYSFVADKSAPQPDAAEKCEFSAPTVFECTLRGGLKFANGHDLTSSDVKFSFDRIRTIKDPNGPGPLLANLDSVEAPSDSVVRFHLKTANDQTFLQVLATSAGPICDEEVFPADSVLPDDDIVAAGAFSGPYKITNYKKNDTIEFTAYPGYVGAQSKPLTHTIIQKVFSDPTNLKLSVEKGHVNVAFRWLMPTDIESLQKNPAVRVWSAESSVIRMLVFNLVTMPGDTDAQKLAIRQAVAASVDRTALSAQVYKGQFTPLCSFIPQGYLGANTSVCDRYGSAPDLAAATKYLLDAGVATPVTLNIQYNLDHYGANSDQEFGLIKQQLESTGLFKVNLQATEWVTYNQERVRDGYPVYQLGWGPDYPDSDAFLTPLFLADSFVRNHFADAAVQAQINAQRNEPDPDKRAALLAAIQDEMAASLPVLPLLRSSQWAVSGANVTGVVLGIDEGLHFNTLAKG